MSILLVLILLAASIFFGFRQYIVYDEDGGLHLEVPWLEETMPDGGNGQISPTGGDTQNNDGTAPDSHDSQKANVPADSPQNNNSGAGNVSAPEFFIGRKIILFCPLRKQSLAASAALLPQLLPPPVSHFVCCLQRRG